MFPHLTNVQNRNISYNICLLICFIMIKSSMSWRRTFIKIISTFSEWMMEFISFMSLNAHSSYQEYNCHLINNMKYFWCQINILLHNHFPSSSSSSSQSSQVMTNSIQFWISMSKVEQYQTKFSQHLLIFYWITPHSTISIPQKSILCTLTHTHIQQLMGWSSTRVI